jgi:hypothetical protein
MRKTFMLLMAAALLVTSLTAGGVTLQATKNKRLIIVSGLTYDQVWLAATEALMANCTIDASDKAGGTISATRVANDDAYSKVSVIIERDPSGTITIHCRTALGLEKNRFFKPLCKVLGVDPKAVPIIKDK